MTLEEAVAAVVRLGLDLDGRENTERVCPACGGVMVLRADLLGNARWVCRRCGNST